MMSAPVTTPDKLIELALRVERASQGSRELDAEILRALGFTWRGMAYWSADDKVMWDGPSRFTFSLDSAMQLIPEGWRLVSLGETVIEGWRLVSLGETVIEGNDPWNARVNEKRFDGRAKRADGDAATPALALTAACLRALSHQGGQNG